MNSCMACLIPVHRRRADIAKQRQQRLMRKGECCRWYKREVLDLEQLHALGYTAATIEQFPESSTAHPILNGEFWRYYWRVNIPADANISWQTCTSTCDLRSERMTYSLLNGD